MADDFDYEDDDFEFEDADYIYAEESWSLAVSPGNGLGYVHGSAGVA